ncbi:MAG: hypothetical protein KAH86_03840 [Methanosarcinales archaeon]|nr:hypothetical protein [Methanosarcinales archaeon]
MDKIIKLSIIFLVLGSILISGCIDSEKPSEIGGLSKNTKSLDTYIIQGDDGNFIIPLRRLTDGKAYTDPTEDVQYRDGDIKTSFSLSGIYKGETFSKAHLEWKDGTPNLLMEIAHEMNPKDGVIEGYMVETFEDGDPYVYIYLDEDWKKQVGDTNIILGLNLDIIQKFEWSEVGDGIYMNKIMDDINRFNMDDIRFRESGVFVGDLTLADITSDSNRDWTAMKMK